MFLKVSLVIIFPLLFPTNNKGPFREFENRASQSISTLGLPLWQENLDKRSTLVGIIRKYLA